MIRKTSRIRLAGGLGAAAVTVPIAFVALSQASAQSDKKAVEEKATAAGSGAGAVIFIDPATGKTRQPEAAEIGALLKSATDKRRPKVDEGATKGPRTFPAAGGGVGMMIDPSMDCAVVMTKSPDGKMKTDCVVGEQAAAAIVNATAAAKKTEAASEK